MTINKTFLIFLMGLMFTIAGCSRSGKVNKSQPPEVTERVAMLMGGASSAKVITETGKATAYRIGTDDRFKKAELGPGVVLTESQRQVLVGLLARDNAYAWGIGKLCDPRYGVRVTFEDGGTLVHVRFCFNCGILEYSPGSSDDFDPINDELVQWVKGVFPDDEAIQSLGTDDEQSGL